MHFLNLVTATSILVKIRSEIVVLNGHSISTRHGEMFNSMILYLCGMKGFVVVSLRFHIPCNYNDDCVM